MPPVRNRLPSTVTSRAVRDGLHHRPETVTAQSEKYNMLRAILVESQLVPDAFRVERDDLINAARSLTRVRREMNNRLLPVSEGLPDYNILNLFHNEQPTGVPQRRVNVGSTDLYKLLHDVALDSLSTESLTA